jgi:hypothetical protein
MIHQLVYINIVSSTDSPDTKERLFLLDIEEIELKMHTQTYLS